MSSESLILLPLTAQGISHTHRHFEKKQLPYSSNSGSSFSYRNRRISASLDPISQTLVVQKSQGISKASQIARIKTKPVMVSLLTDRPQPKLLGEFSSSSAKTSKATIENLQRKILMQGFKETCVVTNSRQHKYSRTVNLVELLDRLDAKFDGGKAKENVEQVIFSRPLKLENGIAMLKNVEPSNGYVKQEEYITDPSTLSCLTLNKSTQFNKSQRNWTASVQPKQFLLNQQEKLNQKIKLSELSPSQISSSHATACRSNNFIHPEGITLKNLKESDSLLLKKKKSVDSKKNASMEWYHPTVQQDSHNFSNHHQNQELLNKNVLVVPSNPVRRLKKRTTLTVISSYATAENSDEDLLTLSDTESNEEYSIQLDQNMEQSSRSSSSNSDAFVKIKEAFLKFKNCHEGLLNQSKDQQNEPKSCQVNPKKFNHHTVIGLNMIRRLFLKKFNTSFFISLVKYTSNSRID